jgi:tetratricopeptide (TPR) repeat protein
VTTNAHRIIARIKRLIQLADLGAAEELCARLLDSCPQQPAAWWWGAVVALRRGAPHIALVRVNRGLELTPVDPRLLENKALCLHRLGKRAESAAIAREALAQANNDGALLDSIGSILSICGDQLGALEAFDRAVACEPGNTRYRFNRAVVLRFLGRFDAAESDYDTVISIDPDSYEAWPNRSDLRPQSADRNHIAALRARITDSQTSSRAKPHLFYALAKELEDLGEYAEAFTHLREGAALRRAQLRYDIQVDVATTEWIIEAFPQILTSSSHDSLSPGRPIFIVGMPRTGSTLLERILSRHALIDAGGEIDSLASAVTEAATDIAGSEHARRDELIRASAQIDFGRLGEAYLERVRPLGQERRCFTDKMPLNYLYCGLIARALPGARIVHTTRHPMATCYAMYKTLFKSGYPFSYDLAELGAMFIAYRRLMTHWIRTIPGVITEVSYERLVTDRESTTKALIKACGLEWEEACLDFVGNAAPVTSASASQVRRSLYTGSLEQWRNYQGELAPLKQQLEAAGIDTQ